MENSVFWDGKEMVLDSLCSELEIDIDVVNLYIKNGESPEDAVNRVLAIRGFNTKSDSSVLSRYERFDYNGEYKSVSYFCKKYGLDRGIIEKILPTVSSFEEAVLIYKEKYGDAIVSFNGVEGRPYKVARSAGMGYSTLYQARKRNGKPFDQLISDEAYFEEMLQKDIEVADFKGTISECIACYGLDLSLIRRRFYPYSSSHPHSLVDVVKSEVFYKQVCERDYTILDCSGHIDDICAALGISFPKSRFYKECLGRECNLDELVRSVITKEYRFQCKCKGPYTIHGVTGSVREICDAFDLVYVTVVNCIVRTDKPVEDILNSEYDWAQSCKTVCHVGRFNGSLLECVDHAGLPLNKIRHLVKDGMTPQQALNYVIGNS